MTPDQLAKSGTEHGTQTAFFAYCAVAMNRGFVVADQWAEIGNTAFLGLPKEVAKLAVPALQWIHAIPNGGSRGDDEKSRKVRGAMLKAEGQRNGVADVFLPWPSSGWHGLYIEFKKPALKPKKDGSKGGVSDEQQEFRDYVRSVGYGWVVCYTWREAVEVVKAYINYRSS